ncbi:MAG TPA: hypothetical protein VJ866_03250 [Pyrinomonadaceae bacterium]|nr:hypothetical protein [Pyrinomonadaceae bacterium]
MRRVLTVLLLLALTVSCSRVAASKERYEKDGLSLSHTPEWRVRSDRETAATRVLILEGPHGALLSLTRFPASHPATLAQYAASVEEKREAATGRLSDTAVHAEGAQTGSVRATIVGREREGLTKTFDISTPSDSTHFSAEFYEIEAGDFRWMLMRQEPAAYHAELNSGIQLVYDSLSLPSAPAPKAAAGAENK